LKILRIAEELKADIKRIELVKPNSSFFTLGGQAMFHFKPRIKPIDINLDEYNLIILGGPTYAWRMSPPMRSFVAKHNIISRKIALWQTSAGDGLKAIDRLKKEMSKSEIVTIRAFQDTKDVGKAQEEIKSWVAEIKNYL